MSRVACLRSFDGWFYGCLTATAVLDAMVFVSVAVISPEPNLKQTVVSMLGAALFVVPFTFFATFIFTAIPAAILIWLGERLRTRAMAFYVGSGVVVGALFCALLLKDISWFGAAFILAGGPAGLVYWRLAGRYVGED